MNTPHGYEIMGQDGYTWSYWGWIRRHADGSLTLRSGFRTYDDAQRDAVRHDRDLGLVGGFDRQVRVIQDIVAMFFGCTHDDLLGRAKRFAYARRVAMTLARELTPASSPELGRLFRRDHTTVLAGVRQINDRPPPYLDELRRQIRVRLK